MPTKWDKKREKRGDEKRRKENVNTAVSLLNLFKFFFFFSNFCFLCMPELNISHLDQRATKCITFNSLQPDSDQKTSQIAWKRIFSKISRSEWVNTFEIVKFFFCFPHVSKNLWSPWLQGTVPKTCFPSISLFYEVGIGLKFTLLKLLCLWGVKLFTTTGTLYD